MKYKHFRSDEDPPSDETPERNLWFAVIDRALKDYCFFFDKLLSTGSGKLIDSEKLAGKYNSAFTIKAITEFNKLKWFLFERTPKQFNLEYLSEQLYENPESMASHIRSEAEKRFREHLAEAERRNQFVALLRYIRETGIK